MAMDKINGSPLTQPGILDRFQVNGKGKDESERTLGKNNGTHGGPAPSDTAEISDNAHQLMDLRAAVDVGRLAIQNAPDVREDKIAEARKRLEQGFYNSPVVQDQVAGVLGNVLTKMDEL